MVRYLGSHPITGYTVLQEITTWHISVGESLVYVAGSIRHAYMQTQSIRSHAYSWNSTRNIGRIGRHLAENPDVKVTMCFGQMPPDVSDFPGGIPAYEGAVYSAAANEPVSSVNGVTRQALQVASTIGGQV